MAAKGPRCSRCDAKTERGNPERDRFRLCAECFAERQAPRERQLVCFTCGELAVIDPARSRCKRCSRLVNLRTRGAWGPGDLEDDDAAETSTEALARAPTFGWTGPSEDRRQAHARRLNDLLDAAGA